MGCLYWIYDKEEPTKDTRKPRNAVVWLGMGTSFYYFFYFTLFNSGILFIGWTRRDGRDERVTITFDYVHWAVLFTLIQLLPTSSFDTS